MCWRKDKTPSIAGVWMKADEGIRTLDLRHGSRSREARSATSCGRPGLAARTSIDCFSGPGAPRRGARSPVAQIVPTCNSQARRAVRVGKMNSPSRCANPVPISRATASSASTLLPSSRTISSTLHGHDGPTSMKSRTVLSVCASPTGVVVFNTLVLHRKVSPFGATLPAVHAARGHICLSGQILALTRKSVRTWT